MSTSGSIPDTAKPVIGREKSGNKLLNIRASVSANIQCTNALRLFYVCLTFTCSAVLFTP